jgi:hypothetical protein
MGFRALASWVFSGATGVIADRGPLTFASGLFKYHKSVTPTGYLIIATVHTAFVQAVYSLYDVSTYIWLISCLSFIHALLLSLY